MKVVHKRVTVAGIYIVVSVYVIFYLVTRDTCVYNIAFFPTSRPMCDRTSRVVLCQVGVRAEGCKTGNGKLNECIENRL